MLFIGEQEETMGGGFQGRGRSKRTRTIRRGQR